MHWYLKVLQNYVGFEGRARRTEYWMFTLVNFLIVCVLGIVQAGVGVEPLLTTLYNLAILLPSLAVAVRRLHDTGRSGFWMFLVFIPFIGAIILIIFFCLDSEQYENDYGQNPKHVDDE